MNATAIPVDELTGQLLDAADAILADTAAVQLIISHQDFLHRGAFRRVIHAGTSISTCQPPAVTGQDAALRLLCAGDLADRGQPRRSRNPRPPAHRTGATSTPGTSPWSLTPSPPPTADPSQLPQRPGPQNGCCTRAGLEPICRPLRIPSPC